MKENRRASAVEGGASAAVVVDGRLKQGKTRNRILDALSEILIERDSLEVTLIDVAKRAGVNHALVGYYFGNKEGMFLALLRRGAHSTPEWLEKLLASKESPEEKLRIHLRGMVKSYARSPVIGMLTDTILTVGSVEAVQEVTDLIIKPLAHFYSELIKQGVGAGKFRPIEPMFLHMEIVGSCNFLFFSRARLEIGYGVKEISPRLEAQFIEHLTDGILGSICI